jgi:hypothetical protein
MISGARTSTGALTFSVDVDANAVAVGGILINPDGAICVTDADPDCFVAGFGVTNAGLLCVSPDDTIASYHAGLPFNSKGQLVVTDETVEASSDSWITGLRIASGVGVCAVGLDDTTLWVDEDTWTDTDTWGEN